ncbi:hypothetical protein CFR75_11835, partial [Komagataeibacter xylinus]
HWGISMKVGDFQDFPVPEPQYKIPITKNAEEPGQGRAITIFHPPHRATRHSLKWAKPGRMRKMKIILFNYNDIFL